MAKRSRAREVALQLLFQRDHNGKVERAALLRFVHLRLNEAALEAFCLRLYEGVVNHLEEIDRRLAAAAENWRLARMATVDRNALRLGAYELLFAPDTPPTVALDEAIELARRYGSADSPGFVNGVLDKLRQNANPATEGMPTRQPFTSLCRALARSRGPVQADLHVHTTHSDGNYTAAQVVDLACRSGLSALALTDHDSLGGVTEARAAAGNRLEVVPAVEISAVYRGREFHLLGYFVRPDDPALGQALERLRASRADRFWEMVERLRDCGVPVEEGELRQLTGAGSLGRRHLAEWLVRARRAGSVRDAFLHYLGDGGRVALPKVRLPVAEAIALVRSAGGVASWAHPSYDCTRPALAELRELGLGALEVEYPSHRAARTRELRECAALFGMAITGGSDCHGPDQPARAVGSCGITEADLERLRRQKDQ